MECSLGILFILPAVGLGDRGGSIPVAQDRWFVDLPG